MAETAEKSKGSWDELKNQTVYWLRHEEYTDEQFITWLEARSFEREVDQNFAEEMVKVLRSGEHKEL